MAWEGKRTICEVLRECGDECTELSISLQDEPVNIYTAMDRIHNLLYKFDEATTMAKKMDGKLREYKADYDKNMWKNVGGQNG